MARVLRSTKITISEDASTHPALQQHKPEERRTESRGPLEPIDNVTETVVVSVDEANEADEEKLLKAAFKSAIGVKKKKKNKKDRRVAKQSTNEEASGDNVTPDENAQTPAATDGPKDTPKNDDNNLMHLLKDMAETHISKPAAAPPAQDITLIRNVPTEPAAHRRTRSQHNSVRQAQPGQYNQPFHYNYPHGAAGQSWSRGQGSGQYRPPLPVPYTYNSHFGGPRGPNVFAGPPPPVFHYGHISHQDHHSRLVEARNEEVQRWLSGNDPTPPRTNANEHRHKAEEEKQEEPIYVYTGAPRYVSNSTIEISAATEGDESMGDAPAEQAVEAQVETQADVEVYEHKEDETAAVEEPEALSDIEANTEVKEDDEHTAQEEKASTLAESETEPVQDHEPAQIDQPEEDEDSFVHHIVGRSPAKPARRRSSLDEAIAHRFASRRGSSVENLVDNLEKFEDIITRSPAKPVSRIEDSVEKLDEMEDVLEELAEVSSGSVHVSPAKAKSPSPISPKTIPAAHVTPVAKVKQNTTPAVTKTPLRRAATVTGRTTTATKASTLGLRGGRAVQSEMAAQKATSGTATVRARAPEVRKSVMSTGLRRAASVASADSKVSTPFSTARPLAKRPISLLAPKETAKSTKPATRPSFELPGEKVARELKEKREAREARMAQRAEAEKAAPARKSVAPVVRSSKPPTKPSFELPGDALSRKKREEQQAKLKKEEEEERKRREFKARPLRKSIITAAPAPRETAASLARKSIIGASGSEISVSKRPLRPSIAEIDHDNVTHSAPRTRVSSKTFERKTSATKPTGPSMSGLSMQRSASNASATAAKKLTGKEVYRRDARAMENAEEEKKAKQEAAKKAREAAAERGRQASKEWAEKQKRKMMEGKVQEQGLTPGLSKKHISSWLDDVEVTGQSTEMESLVDADTAFFNNLRGFAG